VESADIAWFAGFDTNHVAAVPDEDATIAVNF